MKTKFPNRCRGGFTLVELLIGATILSAVGLACYSMLLSSTMLFAKNISLNTASTSLRSGLDRMYDDLNQGYGMPTLINVDGSPATGAYAAGIAFDLYLGGPYVVVNPGGSGLGASTEALTLKHYKTDTLTAQPRPSVNDVIVLDNGATRPVVKTCSEVVASGVSTLSISLKSPLGNSVSWSSNTTKTAALVRKKAYVVAPIAGGAELRFYDNAEGVTDYSNSAGYVVMARGLSNQTTVNSAGTAVPDLTPFSLVDATGAPCDEHSGCSNPFLEINMRVEDVAFNKTLKGKQPTEFNSFLRLDTRLRPRN